MKNRTSFVILILSMLVFWVYFNFLVGAADLVLEATLNSTYPGDQFGWSVASGDVNNDGYADLIVGANKGDTPAGADSSQVFVIFGTAAGIDDIAAYGNGNANITLNGTTAGTTNAFGFSVASGDVNNDEYADVIVGYDSADTAAGVDSGQVFVFFGADYTTQINQDALSYANITLNGSFGWGSAGDQFGVSVASGDVNNDSYDDIIAGCWYCDGGVANSGQAFVFFGADYTTAINENASVYANITINGTYDRLGFSVASGDVNNDNYTDIIVGDKWDDGGGDQAGRAFVFFGADYTTAINENAWAYANITLSGTAASDMFGYSVASGDINNDDYADVIVGANDANLDFGGNAGQVLVFFGADYTTAINETGTVYANITFNATVAGDALGVSVASGDVNNDSYADVIVGANDADPGGASSGQAYVFFGANYTTAINEDALSYANITINGTTTDDVLGWSVASGDFDNDTYDDVIVGAYGVDTTAGTDAGQVYIYDYDADPLIILDAPVDFFNETATGNVTFNYTANDLNLDTCELWGNWTTGWHLNESFLSPASGVTNGSSNITIEDGLYVWSVYCNDTTNNYNNTVENFTLIVDVSTPPIVSLEKPDDYFNETSVVGDGNLTFNYTATDLTELETCELWGNWTGTWHMNESFVNMSKDVTNGSSNVTIEDGLYVWSVYCNDTQGNGNTTVENRTLTVDLTAPNITLDAPIVDFFNETATGNVTFNYTASDVFSTGENSLFEIDTCELWGNWTASGWHLNETFVSPPKDATNGSSNITIEDGLYVWSVYCNDTLGNSNTTVANFTLTVDLTSPSVTLDAPSDNSYDTDGDVNFSFTAVEVNPDQCTLWFRSNATNWAQNDSTAYSNGVQANIFVNLTDAAYVWNVECNGTEDNPTFASANRTLTVDPTVPTTPTVTEPSDTSINLRDSITYKCTSSDATAGISSWAWTLTKPDSTTVTKTGGAVTSNSQSFSGDDTNRAGTYTVKCEVEDKAGLKSSSSKTFTVYYSHHVAAPSAGPSVAAKIDLSTEEEITITEKQGTISTFTLDGTTIHKITIKEVTETIATLKIESETITLEIEEIKEVDVDGDGVNDISITLNSITEGVVDITTKRLAPLPEKVPPEEVPPTKTPPEEIIPEMPEEAPSKALVWILIIVILAVIAVGYWFMKKNKYLNIFSKEPFQE